MGWFFIQTDRFWGNIISHNLRIRRALRLVWDSNPVLTISSAVLVFVQGILPLLPLYLMKLIVDTLTKGLGTSFTGIIFKQAAFYIGLMGAAALLEALCRSVANLVNDAQSYAVTDRVYDIIHAKSIKVDLEYYENSRYYDALHRAQVEAPYRPTRILNGLIAIGQNGISTVAIAALLLRLHWIVSVILLAAFVPGIIIRIKYAGNLFGWQRKSTSTEREVHYLNWVLTGEEYAKEVRLFGLGKLLMSRFHNLRKKLRREKLTINTRLSIAEFVAQAAATIAIFGSLAFIAFRAVNGAITIGDLVMYYQAFQRGLGFMRQLLSSLAGLYEDNLFLSNLFEFLDLEPKVKDPSTPALVPQLMQTGIAFDHVSFKYPTGIAMVLEDIDLTIRPGEIVALVGENGSGKTTLVKVLCRLYDPTFGKITLDGIDLRQFSIEELRRNFSIIFQDYAHYCLTARENIWFGNIDLAPNDERITIASQSSGADEVIKNLSEGYETKLGKMFEGGEEISIGEWQKIALARAFLRDSQIIVLDEPTSALDAKAESEVFKKFRALAKGKTAIIISHRFSTVRMAHRIFVMDKGKIIESGTHDELVKRDGIYARMFELQSQYYK